MQQTNAETFDIVIVGGGMVGLAMAARLAHDLADSGLRLALVDAQKPQAQHYSRDGVANFDSRVSALTVTSRRLLESLKLWQGELSAFACPYREMLVWDADGTGQIAFSSREVRQEELGFIIENSLINDALNEKLASIKTLHQFRGEKVLAYEFREGLNQLQLESGLMLQSTLVIAADGANSFIRQQASFHCREWDYGQEAIVATVETDLGHEHRAAQCFLPTGPLAFLPLCDRDQSQHFCSIVWSCDADKSAELMALDDREFSFKLQAAFENRLGGIKAISQRFNFPLWQRHATDYVQEGLALIGDAAHTIHPLAGQGVNLGLQDVLALSQVIHNACLKGEAYASEQVLSRYQRERKGSNLGMMLMMEAFKRGFGNDDLSIRWLRNTGLSLVDRAKPLKRQLIRKAMGLS